MKQSLAVIFSLFFIAFNCFGFVKQIMPSGDILYDYDSNLPGVWVYDCTKIHDSKSYINYRCDVATIQECERYNWYVEVPMVYSNPQDHDLCVSEFSTYLTQHMSFLLETSYGYNEWIRYSSENQLQPPPYPSSQSITLYVFPQQ